MSVRYQLVMRNGPNPGATYALDGEVMTVGRDPSNTIAINDPEISRQHARMMLQGGKIVIEDNGSTNGTAINGRRISGPHVLKTGEMIAFGEDIVFMFEALNFDPDATVLSSSSHPSAVPRQAPVPPPPPKQAYVGQVPADPVPAAPPSSSQSGSRRTIPLVVGAGALACICACGGFLLWVDAANKWCDFFPFLFGSACG
ncbi:MAG TPA: FHA domain-containing protein [Anaerolineales bacterium]|nr:FHA domain-containing protein [Anaerolineales bacterium]